MINMIPAISYLQLKFGYVIDFIMDDHPKVVFRVVLADIRHGEQFWGHIAVGIFSTGHGGSLVDGMGVFYFVRWVRRALSDRVCLVYKRFYFIFFGKIR